MRLPNALRAASLAFAFLASAATAQETTQLLKVVNKETSPVTQNMRWESTYRIEASPSKINLETRQKGRGLGSAMNEIFSAQSTSYGNAMRVRASIAQITLHNIHQTRSSSDTKRRIITAKGHGFSIQEPVQANLWGLVKLQAQTGIRYQFSLRAENADGWKRARAYTSNRTYVRFIGELQETSAQKPTVRDYRKTALLLTQCLSSDLRYHNTANRVQGNFTYQIRPNRVRAGFTATWDKTLANGTHATLEKQVKIADTTYPGVRESRSFR